MSATHPLVQSYVDQLRLSAARLSARQSAAVEAEVREFLAAALLPDAGDDEVRAALAELGTPDQVVARASIASEPPAYPARPGHVVGRTVLKEIATLAMLVIGPFLNLLPPFGMLIWGLGAILFYSSTVWTRRDKAVGTFLVGIPVLVFAVGLAALALSGDCVADPSGGAPVCPPVPTVGGVNPVYVIAPLGLVWVGFALYAFVRLVRALR